MVADSIKFSRVVDAASGEEIVIDNTDAAATKSGTWATTTFSGGGVFWGSDGTGAVVWDASFRPYGEEDAITGAVSLPRYIWENPPQRITLPLRTNRTPAGDGKYQ